MGRLRTAERYRSPTSCGECGGRTRYRQNGGCVRCTAEKAKALCNEKRIWVEGIKMGSGCVRCGYRKNARALHFHHLDPSAKSFQISQAMSKSRESILAEIAKCVVLCANCHYEVEDGE